MSMTALVPAIRVLIMPRGRHLCRILSRQMNGRPDARISAATAEVATHGIIDVGIAGLRYFVEQSECRHQLPALAISTLNDVDFGPRPAQCVDLRAADALDGHDLAPLHGLDRRYARTHRFAVQVHGAGAAQRFAATILGPHELQLAAQHPEQWCVRFGVHDDCLAVDGEPGHGYSSRTMVSEGPARHPVVDTAL